MGTGKEQKVRIEQSSGLSDTEISRMQKDAEEHASEDKKQREVAELRNKADTMCYQLEKLIKEHSDKLRDADKAPLEAAIQKTREAAKTDDTVAIRTAVDQLEQASHAMSKVLYESAQKSQPGAEAPGADGAAQTGPTDDTIDAEFEVKK
jgi:molecular chaperone DnaK